MTAKVPWPTWSASVDNGRSIPSHLKRALWRLSGICMPNLSNRIVASNCGPMKPRGVAWNGAGGKLILARRGDEFFKFQFQLLDQPRRALGTRPVQFAFELLDPQLEMRDQRLIVRQLRPCVGRFGLPIDGFGPYPGDRRRGRIAF